jgi:hypothetical protein
VIFSGWFQAVLPPSLDGAAGVAAGFSLKALYRSISSAQAAFTQIGLLAGDSLPVRGAETARTVLDPQYHA